MNTDAELYMSNENLNTVHFIIILLLLTTINQVQNAVVPYVETSKVSIDGVVSKGEYAGNFSDPSTGMTVYWEHNSTDFFIALESHVEGWLAIGFGPRGIGMDGADMKIGYAENNGSVIHDEIGIGRTHYYDTSKGGNDDILSSAGLLNNRLQTLEFIIPLNSGDSLDQKFNSNITYGFFLAYQASVKDIGVIHSGFSKTFDLILEPTPNQTNQNSISYITMIYAAGVIMAILLIDLIIRAVKRPKVYRYSEMK
jgi:hypothetical protein